MVLKKIILLLLFLNLSYLSNIDTKENLPLRIKIKEGYVYYKVETKAFGIFSDKIEAYNYDVRGEFELSDVKINGELIISSKGFESDNTRRDYDVAKILKYKEYPQIIFNIKEIKEKQIEKIIEQAKGEFKIKATLTVAGVSKDYDELIIKYEKKKKNQFKVTTNFESKFTDFKIEPPSFGAIIKKAPDHIFLKGELLIEILGEEIK